MQYQATVKDVYKRQVIMAACVEIAAVVPGVIEHAVQYNAHATSGGFAAQRTEVLLTAEQRVDALVIAGIVAVIGIRLKDRIEIMVVTCRLSR